MDTDSTFDLVVLGAGSGGIAGAIRAARHGARVALVEPGLLGGTCVNVGCVPKKAMWLAAELADGFELARGFGFDVGAPALDWNRFVAVRSGYIDAIHKGYRERMASLGITLVVGHGCFADDGAIMVGERRLAAPHVLIATGARPRRVHVSGGELGMVSDDLFALRAAPRRLLVVGSGYVALEFAGVFAALGSQVEVLARGERLVQRFDADISVALEENLRAAGVGVHLRSEVVEARRDADGTFSVTCTGEGVSGGFDALLWAVGRQPNVEGLRLDRVGIGQDGDGHVQVDSLQDTTRDGVYAVGDVTAAPELTPVAIAAARRLMDRLFGGEVDAKLDYSLLPTVLFSHPPVGTIGLTEAEARMFHGDSVRCYAARFRPMRGALAGRPQRTLVKLVCAGSDERIVGLHVCGEAADEMLQGFAVAVVMGACKRDFDRTVAIHPTSAEEFVLLG